MGSVRIQLTFLAIAAGERQGLELTIANSGVRGTVRDLDSDKASWVSRSMLDQS